MENKETKGYKLAMELIKLFSNDKSVRPEVNDKKLIVQTPFFVFEVSENGRSIIGRAIEGSEYYFVISQAINLDRKYRDQIESGELEITWARKPFVLETFESWDDHFGSG